jgi:hypothetical protein
LGQTQRSGMQSGARITKAVFIVMVVDYVICNLLISFWETVSL